MDGGECRMKRGTLFALHSATSEAIEISGALTRNPRGSGTRGEVVLGCPVISRSDYVESWCCAMALRVNLVLLFIRAKLLSVGAGLFTGAGERKGLWKRILALVPSS